MFSSVGKHDIVIFIHSVIFINWMYCDRSSPKIPACLCVFLCVCPRWYAQTSTKCTYFLVRWVEISQNLDLDVVRFLVHVLDIIKKTVCFQIHVSSCLNVFIQPSFWPEVDYVVRRVSILNLTISIFTYVPTFKTIESKFWPWQCYRLSIKLAAVTSSLMLMSWNTIT